MAPSLAVRTFGYLPGGAPIQAWTLSGAGGLVAEVINYGATVTRLLAPDREGSLADVVLGFRDLQAYREHGAYFGAMAGRVAGRITGGRFSLEGRSYQLACNNGPNHLHGGLEGFDKKVWTAEPASGGNDLPALRLRYRSPDGDQGYPGAVDVTVTYTVTDDNVLLVECEASADQPSPLNLTHHSYFNLAGEGSGSVAEHELQIHSGHYVTTDEHMTLLGRMAQVDGRANDFREPRKLGEAMPHLYQNHGDLYLLREQANNDSQAKLLPAARLTDPRSGRVLEVSTTAPYVQFYTGAALDGALIGKSGVSYQRYAGVCLECEGYPDGVNTPALGDILLRPGNPRRETTAYAFLQA